MVARTQPLKRRPAQRPAEILEAAAQVFAKNGYERATTREIAALAGVSEGTLYNYYGSKRDILIALVKGRMEKAGAIITSLQAGPFEAGVAQMIAEGIRAAREQPFMIMLLQQAVMDPEVGRFFDEMIAGTQREMMRQFEELASTGVVRAIDPFIAEEAMGSMLMGLTIGAELAAYGWHQEPRSPEAVSRGVVDVLMNGLRACSPADSAPEKTRRREALPARKRKAK